MKRLLRMSIDILLASVAPIIGWYILGFLVKKSLINVFALTYPLQFVWLLFNALFNESVNIYCHKHNIIDKDDLIVTAGVVGTSIAALIFGILIWNVDSYILGMNMDYKVYKVFCVYSMLQLLMQLAMNTIIVRLQYLEKNKEANLISARCNLVNLIVLLFCCLITNNELLIASITMCITVINNIHIIIKQKIKVKINLKFYKGFKYAIPSIIHNIFFIIIFFNGIGSVSNYGKTYLLGINVANLATDTQWDCMGSIESATCIDVSKGKFSYKQSIRNAFGLLFIIILSVIIMVFILSFKYNITNFIITIIFLEIATMFFYILYGTWTAWLKVNGYIKEVSCNKIISSTIRTIVTLSITTPYKMTIGMLVGTLYQMITFGTLYHRKKKKK